MNIISNVCSGAFLYQKLGIEFNNPFMWSVLHYRDLKELVTNFRDIAFSDAQLVRGNRVKDSFSISIGNGRIIAEYIHYKWNKNCQIPTKIGEDVFYNRIWKYTYSKYMERLERMQNNNENPVFLIMDQKDDLTYEHTLDLINSTKYKIILFTNHDYPINQNLNLIKTNLSDDHQYKYEPKKFIEGYYNEILRLL